MTEKRSRLKELMLETERDEPRGRLNLAGATIRTRRSPAHLALLILVACTPAVDSAADTSVGRSTFARAPITTGDAEEAIRSLYLAIEDYDSAAMRALLTEDFELAEPERGVRWTREEFVSMVLAFEDRGEVHYAVDEFFTELCTDAGAYTGYRNRLTFQASAGGDPVQDATIEFSVVTMTDTGPKIDRIHGFVIPPGED